MDSLALLATTHAELLRAIAVSSGRHYEGLGHASRCKQLPLSTKQRRHLLHLDVAFNWSRHITAVKCESLIFDILSSLKTQSFPDCHGVRGVAHELAELPGESDHGRLSVPSGENAHGVGTFSGGASANNMPVVRNAMHPGAVANGVDDTVLGARSDNTPGVFTFPPSSYRSAVKGSEFMEKVPKVIKKPFYLKRTHGNPIVHDIDRLAYPPGEVAHGVGTISIGASASSMPDVRNAKHLGAVAQGVVDTVQGARSDKMPGVFKFQPPSYRSALDGGEFNGKVPKVITKPIYPKRTHSNPFAQDISVRHAHQSGDDADEDGTFSQETNAVNEKMKNPKVSDPAQASIPRSGADILKATKAKLRELQHSMYSS